MPPEPGFPNKAHRSPVHLIHFFPIPGRPRPLSECNRQKQVYLTYFKNIILSFCCQKLGKVSDPFNQAIEASALLPSPTLGRSCCRVTIGRGEFHHEAGYK